MKKTNWKKIIIRTILLFLFLGVCWLINLIWFKPLNIRHFYDRVFIEFAISNPEMVTVLGIPVLYDWTKDDLTDVSDKKQWEEFDKLKKDLSTLRKYNRDRQSDANVLNTDILDWFLNDQVESEPYFYHNYPVNQLFGVQSNLPSFLENDHRIRNKSDVEAYISRLSKFGKKFDQVLEGLNIRKEKGITPPTFVIDKVLDEMKGFTGQTTGSEIVLDKKEDPVKSNILYSSIDTKLAELTDLTETEKENYLQRVTSEIDQTVFPAYQKLIDHFTELRAISTNDAGVWKLPDGKDYYSYQLKSNTTTTLDPSQIHEIGLQEVERIIKEMWDILISEGYTDTTRTIGSVIQDLNKEERFLFPNTDDGRAAAIEEYTRIIDEINAKLGPYFDIRPNAPMEIKRVPEFKEEGSAGAYYNGPSMDGAEGGTFFINLRDMSEIVKFGMKTLAYHEGIPGHHFQIAIQNELEDVPIFRTIVPFTAYAEGWALYTEQLAWEIGMYDNDPFGNLGRLQAEMFRAVRLVVDTGIHTKKWTREQAIEYMVNNTGMTTTEVISEIERYIVMPGQACAYKIGMMKILELRERAKNQLGDKFNIKDFHNVVLKNGSVPLEILDQIVDNYIKNFSAT